MTTKEESIVHLIEGEKLDAARDSFGTMNALYGKTQDESLHLRALRWQLKNIEAAVAYWKGMESSKVHLGLPVYDSTGTVLVSADLAGWLPYIPHFRALGVIAAPDCHSYLCKGWPTLVHGPAEAEFPALVRQFLARQRAEGGSAGRYGKYSLSALLFGAGFLFWNSSHPIARGKDAWEYVQARLAAAKASTENTILQLER